MRTAEDRTCASADHLSSQILSTNLHQRSTPQAASCWPKFWARSRSFPGANGMFSFLGCIQIIAVMFLEIFQEVVNYIYIVNVVWVDLSDRAQKIYKPRSSWKLFLHSRSAMAFRFPFAHSVLSISGALRSTRLLFGLTQRMIFAFAAFRSLTCQKQTVLIIHWVATHVIF